MSEKISYTEFIDYMNSVIALYENGNEHKYTAVKREVSILENRMNDKNLYLGVVGSFSSGKSTFINSVIHKNLLPTDETMEETQNHLSKSKLSELEIQEWI